MRDMYATQDFIPLHAPKFQGNEKKYLLETIDSTFVSSVGAFVDEFEKSVAEYTGARYAVATVNGTAALHIALRLVGVELETEVVTQSLTFVATCNAIRYCGARPLFVDVDRQTLGLSAESLKQFLEEHAEVREDGCCWNRSTARKISACLPMHTFGFPVELDAIRELCSQYHLPLVEDATESLGSQYHQQHTGAIGRVAAISFNGNKIITTGGGGMILTQNEALAKQAKHLTTTAKLPHQWESEHDQIGYNYRLPNLNAALGVAQMESLPEYLKCKRKVAKAYQQWGDENGIRFVVEGPETTANYWLNTVITENQEQRDQLLQTTNAMKVMTRPAWKPMHLLKINSDCQQQAKLTNTNYLYQRIVNVPSSITTL